VSKPHSQPNSDAEAPDVSRQDDFEAIFACHQVSLRHFLLGVLKDEALVQDALQSTYIKLIEKGDTVENPAAIKSWLFRVGYNEAMQLRRKQSNATKHLEKFARQVDWTGRETNDPDTQILEQELKSQVTDALKLLSPQQFEVVEKRIYQGLKFREIAQELDVPLGTVLARMHSSLKKLKPVLDHFQKDS
jgi:RNA polymerase sigma-70 factor (ECF subfamily)